IYEFYVSVIDDTDKPQGFRYWSVSPNQPNRRHVPITFYIVDESSLLQSQEWRLRRLRRDMMNHIRVSLNQYLRNRLTSVVALTELLTENPGLVEETSGRLLGSLDDVLDSLDHIIDSNTIYDGYDAPRVRLREVPEVISTWGDNTRRIICRGHALETDVLVPSDYLERILLPLVQNAIEASYSDEVVEIDIWELGNGYARLDISDKGDGMNEYARQRAEDPFFSTKPGHLGLGLPQAHEALTSIGGQWRIESAPREGTRITVLIPVDEPEDVLWPEEKLHPRPEEPSR
ncbi:MAG: HAMP domain-containing sensor histidine kinase, partial [Myxococcota bacterium]